MIITVVSKGLLGERELCELPQLLADDVSLERPGFGGAPTV